jgi:ABC-type phosphate/phosphonate transport system permease subunit
MATGEIVRGRNKTADIVQNSSFCFQIADSLAYASVDYSQRFESIQQRPLLILDVFAGSFDLIFRVATFAAVAYFTVTQSTDSARHRLMKSGSIAAVLILSALTIIGIAFRGVNEGYEEAYYSVVNTSSYLDYIQQERAVELWHLRIDQVQMAFYAVFLAAVLSVSVASFQARIVSSATCNFPPH